MRVVLRSNLASSPGYLSGYICKPVPAHAPAEFELVNRPLDQAMLFNLVGLRVVITNMPLEKESFIENNYQAVPVNLALVG